MAITLGFDVYGTLIDTAGVTAALTPFTGELAPAFSNLWREKQLEYSFRRGLMQNYKHFAICTRQALDFSCSAMNIHLSEQEKDLLMANYRTLPAFPDVQEALPQLQEFGFRLFAFSNGRAADVAALLENANVNRYFIDVVSTDEIKSFKPNPAVYAHFLRRSQSSGQEAWLISGNPFDVIGAQSAGMSGAWVKRSEKALFDPWEIEPAIVVHTILELRDAISTTRL
ncbi:MAG: haloacid dehalogenase type II [Desulfobacterales bacterium]|nr:haloacid dehalogenase type II [Deltaproteobacteria bacterium]NNK95439.1 haloacid dehalogenase type II [Desulfobacterales bacterium]